MIVRRIISFDRPRLFVDPLRTLRSGKNVTVLGAAGHDAMVLRPGDKARTGFDGDPASGLTGAPRFAMLSPNTLSVDVRGLADHVRPAWTDLHEVAASESAIARGCCRPDALERLPGRLALVAAL